MSTTVDPVNEVEPTPAKASLWEDFVDIFYAPSSVFARRAEGKFGLALTVLIVAVLVLTYLTINAMQPVMDGEFARQSAAAMAKNPNVTQEQLSAGRKFFENFGPIFFGIGILIGVFGTGIVIWLVGKLFDAKESVAAAIMIATYSEVPRVVQILINAAQALFMSPEKLTSFASLTLSPARFMDPSSSQIAIALATRLDLFTIWITVLLAIGIHVVGKIPKPQAAIVAAIAWLVGALPAILGAARSG
jgi:hypothetical protein